jgi:hypothetical protein
MRNTASFSLKIAFYATIVLLVTAVILTITLEAVRPAANRLPFFDFEFSMFKAILAGFVVSMLGILIPAVASEAHQRSEQRKASRIAYSEAKTSVDYLKLHLATASLSEAAAALQTAHFRKHQAELYDDFPEWLEKRYGTEKTALQWDEEMYGKLFCARLMLERNAAAWDGFSPAERIALLDSALPTMSELKKKLPCEV